MLEVSVKNVVAFEFYSKMGFKKVSVRPKYYSNVDDAIIMSKEYGS